MRLRRLELQGFKSFLDRTVLSFETGVTGVVGPNGCGKSNIVDAIMWVMGEQSPKHLRGESMTDIIFNGSDTKAPTSMAEVSLVMDRQGVALAPQFAAFDKADEISVTRRIYRDGTGEFLINKTACRLKDIHELFMDTGVGRRAYSIIEQGQIDRMINVKPEDRRFLFEEVAGITKYKAKRKEAEKKLELTRGNLVRLQDIVTELEKQIRSLKIQATKAKKFKEMKTELEVSDLFLLGRSLSTHTETLERLGKARAELQNERSESDALFSQVDSELTELEILRIDQEKEYQRLGELERDLTLALQKLQSDIALLEERKKFITQSKDQLSQEADELRKKEELLVADNEAAREEAIAVEDQVRSLEIEVTDKERELQQLQDQRGRLIQAKDSSAKRLAEISGREIHLSNQKTHAEERIQEVVRSQEALSGRISELAYQLEQIRQNLTTAEQKIEECQQRAKDAEVRSSDLNNEYQTTSQLVSQAEDELFKLRENFHAKNSRLESLKELQQNLEGYSPTAREVLLRLDGASQFAVPLAEVLTPDADVEELLELLLGPDMSTLVVETTEQLNQIVRLIEEKGLERVRVVALSEIESANTGLAPVSNVASLSEKVRPRIGYERIARKWLDSVYLCANADEELSLRQQFPGRTFLAQGSRIISHADAAVASGALPSRSGVFARRREIEELEVLCASLDTELTQKTQMREELLAKLEEQESLKAQLKDTLSEIHVESMGLRKEREKVQSDLGRAERDRRGLDEENERYEAQVMGVREQLQRFEQELASMVTQREELQGKIQSLETEIAASAQAFEDLMARVQEKKIERSTLNERVNSIQYRVEKLVAEVGQVRARMEHIQEQQLREEQELAKLDSERGSIQSGIESKTQEQSELMVKISDARTAFSDTSNRLNALREQKDELQDRREKVLSEIQELELKIAGESAKLEQVKGIAVERYHQEPSSLPEGSRLSLEQLPLLGSQLEVTWDLLMPAEQENLLQEHVKNMREKLDRYGEVNLTAIQEYDEVQKRYDFLMVQKTDLENSIKILEEAILKIDESTKTRFNETFEAVNAKFKEIFPILFNGGKAEMALSNPENLLESGVEVMVQPPGKRLQSMTLLSGGEKALTAVSLILAIFARKPSPFCLLDEVDAPLDDANVSRFNTVIRKMSEKTQFIVITHNKKTMEIAEALYGVTMERAGISKMTSVRLH